MTTQSDDNKGAAYREPSFILLQEHDCIQKAYCRAMAVSTGLKGRELKKRIGEDDRSTYKLLFGNSDLRLQDLNTMELVYLNWHRWTQAVSLSHAKGITLDELLDGEEKPYILLTFAPKSS
jgi:hypothetical protein